MNRMKPIKKENTVLIHITNTSTLNQTSKINCFKMFLRPFFENVLVPYPPDLDFIRVTNIP